MSLPVWAVALLCGASAQLFKLLIYSAARGRLALQVLGQSVGLPSLHAAVCSCLAVLMGLRAGWEASVTAFCLIFAGIVIHDAMRLKGASQEQKEVLVELVQALEAGDRFQRQMAVLLNVRAHHPLHVAIGTLFGLLFALAFGLPNP